MSSHIENIDPSSNFHTCIHRSVDKVQRTIHRCSCQGGNYTVSSYECKKREILDVTEEICKNCQQYQPK